MGKKNGIFTRKPQPSMDPAINQALRELAGWPSEEHQQGGYRARFHSIDIHRDASGRVIGSVEHFDEDEYEEYSDNWGK